MAPDSPDSPGPSWADSHAGTPEQALDIVRSRYARPKLPDGSPAELRVHEFDEGYLVYPVVPPDGDAADTEEPPVPEAPAAPGGGKIVVAKETGETFTTPNLPTERAIELYRRTRARQDP